MVVKEIVLKDLDVNKFIEEKAKELAEIVGDGVAINALSGGVDSSAVTMLGHKALGKKLKTYKLSAPPVYEGLAAAGGRLYAATIDGKLLCFGKKQ